MGISFSVPCDPCINKAFHWLDEKVGYTHNLKKNLLALETAMEKLKAKRDDLSRRVAREEDRGQQGLAEIKVWLSQVMTIENRVNDLFADRDVQVQKLCLCGFCSKSLISSYRYGKTVFLTLRGVEEELKNEVFDVIADQAQIPEVQERQLQPTIVGQGTMLDTAWKHLKEDGVGLMGMYGMGGVGKTTLLKQINNKFSEESRRESWPWWRGVETKKRESKDQLHAIYNFLRKKRFVLFLDDIWEKVDLVEIGIPVPTIQNRCKVVFTTRSQAVCTHMGVEDPMEVQCLGETEAFDLFQKKVGKTILGSDPEILDLARKIAKKCSGLPLALNVIGETMSCKRTVQEWRHAIDVLSSYAAQFLGMEDKILPLLMYSYDNLKEENYKSCLLYCALFPEDATILKEKLIDYWICEGIIDGRGSIEKATNKGYEIIGSLVCASLLMDEVDEWGVEYVCMHDVIREMALWIASDLGIEKEAFIVHAGVGLDKMPKVEKWNVVRRMSLMKNKIPHLAGKPECPELTTLLLQDTNLKKISSEFFKSMPKLVVLDLSDNDKLYILPAEVSELVSLQYLNLSRTGICHLPMKEMKKLKELIHLDLEYTTKLASIAGISSLHSLRVLKLFTSRRLDPETMKELKTLEHLQVLTLEIHHPVVLEEYLSSQRLTSSTITLAISDINMKSSGIVLPETLQKLWRFFIVFSSISEIKMVSLKNLSEVFIGSCEGLKEMTLLMFASNLKYISVSMARQLEDIINKEKACESEESGIVPFPKLVKLELRDLPKLKSIYWSPLPLPCLKDVFVGKCPNLKKLPLDSQSCSDGENGLVIRYEEKEWIEGVEWEDEATKTRFLSSCEQDPFQLLMQQVRSG
ncbi:hypothetical protein AALP_AA2G015600 [Arabis alpina]|uniref:NB-ARC domain-containing protein n=1 Tax=Arabis alpina TaxID=50452 RepID=A0A087HEP0_ARAAL|nr:hypothetical protein AALP_AA2G015600 [Arabis alpina]